MGLVRLCSQDCPGVVHAKGLCSRHYLRLRRTGSLDLTIRRAPVTLDCPSVCGCDYEGVFAWCDPMRDLVRAWLDTSPREPPPSDRLAAAVVGPCHVGLVAPNQYSYKTVRGQKLPLHRVALILTGVVLPSDAVVEHLCRNPPCYAPLHLESVTHRENSQRGSQARKTHCNAGHPFSESNTYIRRNGTRQCLACTNQRRSAQ